MNSIGQNFEFDNLDIQILRILMEEETIPYTERAKRLVVSRGRPYTDEKNAGSRSDRRLIPYY